MTSTPTFFGAPLLASEADQQAALAAAGPGQDIEFLWEEWHLVIDTWSVTSEASYRDMPRLGRRQRVTAARRDALWSVFAAARNLMAEQGVLTRAAMFHRLAQYFQGNMAPFDHVLVDEAQDVSVAELQFLAAVAGGRPNGLFFAGDIGQRIFRAAFPWKAVGVDIQGRSRNLKVCYRTSQQIRAKSDLLLPTRLTESDGAYDDRRGIMSIFEGPAPVIAEFKTAQDETEAVAGWIAALIIEGFEPVEIAVLVRDEAQFARAAHAITLAGFKFDPGGGMPSSDAPVLRTMHQAKGKEFRAVAVMACDSEIVPSEKRLLTARDEATLGSGLIDHIQKMTMAARMMADMKVWAHRS